MTVAGNAQRGAIQHAASGRADALAGPIQTLTYLERCDSLYEVVNSLYRASEGTVGVEVALSRTMAIAQAWLEAIEAERAQ